MDDPIIPFELKRMLVGDHPALFYLEIVVRTGLIYLYTLALIRWIGGRSVAQLSMVDLLLVIALGSAVGDAPFYADVPLLAAMIVITVVVAINKGIDTLIQRSDRAKSVIDGESVPLVEAGRLLPDGMRRRTLSPLEVKSMLRLEGISNLGQVEAAYHEAGGGLSVFRRNDPLPGLPIVPPRDVAEPRRLLRPGDAADGLACCANCGALRRADSVVPDVPCRNCSRTEWTAAVKAMDSEPGLID